MTDIQRSDQTKSAAPLVSGFAKGATIAGALTWVLSLLSLLTAKPHGGGFEALGGGLLLLAIATLFLLFVALPSLIISYARRR